MNNRSIYFSLLLTLFFLFSGSRSYALIEHKEFFYSCHSIPKHIFYTGDYCIYKPKEGSNPDFVYHFHGIFGNKKRWKNKKENQLIRRHWRLYNLDAPTVISITFGRVAMITPKSGHKRSGSLEALTEKLIPHIEKQLGGLKGKRKLFGVSLGAFNASQVFFRRPDLFSSVALVSPPVTTPHPYSSKEVIQEYAKRTGAKVFKVEVALRVSRRYFSNNKDWLKRSPFHYFNRKNKTKFPPLYLSVAQYDNYGFQEGGNIFAKQLQGSGQDLNYHYLKGATHAQYDIESLAEYLIK